MAQSARKSGFQKGHAKFGGRRQGVPAKTTILREAILEAATRAGGKAGVEGYLARQAIENPAPFMALLGKVLPLQIGGDPDGAPIANSFTWLPPQ